MTSILIITMQDDKKTLIQLLSGNKLEQGHVLSPGDTFNFKLFSPDKKHEFELNMKYKYNTTGEGVMEPFSGSSIFYTPQDERDRLHARIAELEAKLVEQDRAAERLVIEVLGPERYDNSPCQAHPYELVYEFVRELEAERDRLERLLGGVRNDMKAASKIIDSLQTEHNKLLEQIEDLQIELTEMRIRYEDYITWSTKVEAERESCKCLDIFVHLRDEIARAALQEGE
jgi:hypothetical protein